METKKSASSVWKKGLIDKGVVLLCIIIYAYFIAGDIERMNSATTGYDRCYELCQMFQNISIVYFFCLLWLIHRLTYINKQYTKWNIRLYYAFGVSVLLFFMAAGFMMDYVGHHVEPEYITQMPTLARMVFTGSVAYVVLAFFLVPRYLKDTMKLKEEQELTI